MALPLLAAGGTARYAFAAGIVTPGGFLVKKVHLEADSTSWNDSELTLSLDVAWATPDKTYCSSRPFAGFI